MSALVTLEYNGKQYVIEDEYATFTDGVLDEGSEFQWNENGNSCDCNRSLFIRRQCDPNFPDMDCTDEIKLIKIEEKK